MAAAQHNQHGKQPPPRRRREFTPEFKRDAVELVRTSGRPIAQVAKELGIYDSTLGNWVRQAQIDAGEREGLTSQEQERLVELERENAKLRMERELAQTNRRLLGHGTIDQVMRYRLGRCSEGRWVPGRRRLPGGRGDALGLVRLDRPWDAGAVGS